MAIQIRRGTNAEWESNNSNIVVGEPAIATDEERFFVGTDSGAFAEFANLDIIAPAYDTSTSYEVGDVINRQGKLYSCNTPCSGAFNSVYWDEKSLTEILKDLENEIDYAQYEIGYADGELITINNGASEIPVKDLKIDINAVQDGEPWVDSVQDKTPYLFRAMSSVDVPRIGNRETDKLVGGSVAWNQLVPIPTSDISKTQNNVTFTDNRDGSYSVSTTAEGASAQTRLDVISSFTWVTNHIYYACGSPSVENDNIFIYSAPSGAIVSSGKLIKKTSEQSGYFGIIVKSGTILTTSVKVIPQIFDLTQMFGTTIADYIYNLEQTTAGAGVAWFKKLFPNFYYAYNAGSIENVSASAHETTGFNQWDEEWEVGSIDNSTGVNVTDANNIRSKNFCKCVPNTTYYFSRDSRGTNIRYYFYDASYNFISGGESDTNNGLATTPVNAAYFKVRTVSSYGNTYKNDICVNLSSDKNGTYEPYVKHSYPLDADLVLRGIPKLDANNNLYYDGDTYESSGQVTRKYTLDKLFYDLNWNWNAQRSCWILDSSSRATLLSRTKASTSANAIANIILNGYLQFTENDFYNHGESMPDKSWAITTNGGVYFKDSSIISTSYNGCKTLTNTLDAVYELATPTTETADPFTNPQIVDSYGTEEYVTTGIVPVGHESSYSLTVPISGWTGCEVNVTGVNIWDEEWEVGSYSTTSGTKATSTNQIRCKNKIPIAPNTQYYCKCPVGNVWGLFFDEDDNVITGYDASGSTSVNASLLTNTVGGSQIPFTTPPNGSSMVFYVTATYGTTYNHDISINYPSTDHDYHAYNGHTYSISWQTEAGTVYGGTIDVTTGVLTLTHGEVDLGTLNWLYDSYRFYVLLSDAETTDGKTNTTTISDRYEVTSVYASGNGKLFISTGHYVSVWDSAYTDATAFKNSVSNSKLVYELATPQTYQLTPTQVRTILGTNNLWNSMNSNNELAYRISNALN